MKLQLNGNSLRIGVSRPELERFLAGGPLEETACIDQLSSTALKCALKTALQFPPVKVQYGLRGLTIVLSQEQAKLWSKDGVVGIYSTLNMGLAQPFEIIVEKDFGCIDQVLEMAPDPIGPAPIAA
jgi:hypothetical protein